MSPTTVSNVLHGRTGRMAPETLQKVQSILDQTRYVSNMGAQILGRHGSRLIALIGYIVDRTGFDEFKKWILKDVELGPKAEVTERLYWGGKHYDEK